MSTDKANDHRPEECDVAIIVPVFDDWMPFQRLLKEIDATLRAAKLTGRVVAVDDGSSIDESGLLRDQEFSSLRSVEVVHLFSNQGHQRAIAVGIVYLVSNAVEAKSVVVMDGDGEDRPDHIPRLVEELDRRSCSVVFAQRTERFETLLFRLMYQIYRMIYRIFLGISLRGGNFSALRVPALSVLATMPELWNHYLASVAHSRLRFATLGLPRGRRYAGKTHMNYQSLIVHGLSSISDSGDLIGARILIALSAILLILLLSVFGEIVARFSSYFVPPTWLIVAGLAAIGLTMQWILIVLMFTLLILGRRKQAQFIPLQDAQAYVKSVEHIRTWND